VIVNSASIIGYVWRGIFGSVYPTSRLILFVCDTPKAGVIQEGSGYGEEKTWEKNVFFFESAALLFLIVFSER
jgi:hypothetical protein